MKAELGLGENQTEKRLDRGDALGALYRRSSTDWRGLLFQEGFSCRNAQANPIPTIQPAGISDGRNPCFWPLPGWRLSCRPARLPLPRSVSLGESRASGRSYALVPFSSPDKGFPSRKAAARRWATRQRYSTGRSESPLSSHAHPGH